MPPDATYLKIVVDPIRVCAKYRPKMGDSSTDGLSLEDFRLLYGGDPFYSWFGLDHPLMYAAHKAAGGMTSIYRQIGIGCEKLFCTILKDSLGLAAGDVTWGYELPMESGKTRKLKLDGRIPVSSIKDSAARARVQAWLAQAGEAMKVDPKVFAAYQGAVFEVRQGYKSKDSKRQNADIANAASAYKSGHVPVAIILSGQIDGDILIRYRQENWLVLTGHAANRDTLSSTYAFMKDVVGYDLGGFFQRNSTVLKMEIEKVLKHLLSPQDPPA